MNRSWPITGKDSCINKLLNLTLYTLLKINKIRIVNIN